ncbi:MAG: Abi-alpha family protein [Brevinema sp.]
MREDAFYGLTKNSLRNYQRSNYIYQDLLNDSMILPRDRQIENPPKEILLAITERIFSDTTENYLKHCYFKLLIAVYDKDKQNLAFLSFLDILGKLYRDQVHLLRDIKRIKSCPISMLKSLKLEYGDNFLYYLGKLIKLNIIKLDKSEDQQCELTDFGKIFVEACIPDDLEIERYRDPRKNKKDN